MPRRCTFKIELEFPQPLAGVDEAGCAPLEGPVALHVQIVVPDNGVRDVTTYGKMIGDALTGIVILQDRWQVLRRTTWEVPGIDRANPRAVLRIEPWAG